MTFITLLRRDQCCTSVCMMQVRVQEVPLGAAHMPLLRLLHRDHARVVATASGLAPAVLPSGLLDVRPLQAAIQVRGLLTPHCAVSPRS